MSCGLKYTGIRKLKLQSYVAKCLDNLVYSSLDDSPSPPAPFEHRIVSVKQTEVTTCYSVCRHEVLGG